MLCTCAGSRPVPDDHPEAWCNQRTRPSGRVWPLPVHGGASVEAAATKSAKRPVWLVIWATWCQPCLDELPHIDEALQEMRQRGVAPELILLSLDADAAVLDAAVRRGPSLLRQARVLRASSTAAFDAWAEQLAFDAGTLSLPIHVLAGPDGSVSCAHTGALTKNDVAVPARLLLR